MHGMVFPPESFVNCRNEHLVVIFLLRLLCYVVIWLVLNASAAIRSIHVLVYCHSIK